MNIYYVYQYLQDDGTPYYVGKGKGRRAFKPHAEYAPVPPIEQIQFVATNLTEQESFELERKLILQYGRVDQGTGTLLNRTAGGQGSSGRIVSPESRDKVRGERNPMYGKQQPESVKQAISQGAKKFNATYWTEENRKAHGTRVTGDANPAKTSEARKKISEARKANGTSWNKGKPMSDQHRKNVSIAAQNRTLHTCPHCGKKATGSNYTRWHNDNCKQKGA